MRIIIALFLLNTVSPVVIAASSDLRIGDQAFKRDDEQLRDGARYQRYYPPGENSKTWTRFVTIWEYYTINDPKLHLASEAKRFLSQVPDLKFTLTEDKETGAWILDFVAPTSDRVQTSRSWFVLKARKAKKGIMVIQHVMRFRYTKDVSEVASAIEENRKKLTDVLYGSAL